MSTLYNQRVAIPAGKRLPQLHNIPVPTRLSESSVATVNRQAEAEDDANPLEAAAASSVTPSDQSARICMVKRVTDPTLQLAHMINAIRAPAKTDLRARAHRLLVDELKICSPGFDLDDPSNMIWLSSDLHIMLDLYSVFFLAPSMECLEAILSWLREANDSWQAACDIAGGGATERLLDLYHPCLRGVKYNIYILHPTYFYPNSALLLPINDDPSGGQAMWNVFGGDLVKESVAQQTLPPFLQTPAYAQSTQPMPLNPLLLLLNGEIKFRQHLKVYGEAGLSDRTSQIGSKMGEVVDAIYFKAEPREGTPGAKIDAIVAKAKEEVREFMVKQRDAQRQAQLQAGGGSRSSPRLHGGMMPSGSSLSSANLAVAEAQGQEEQLDEMWEEMEASKGGGTAEQKRGFLDLYQNFTAETSNDFPYALQL